MKELNLTKMECPKPVIETKKAYEQYKEDITSLVDNEVAVNNLKKLAESLGSSACVTNENNIYKVFIPFVEKQESSKEMIEISEDTVISFGSNLFGRGSEELGEILMKSFMYTLKEDCKNVKALLFFNSGVLLTTGEYDFTEDLREMQKAGIKIISCGTCLDFYNKKNELKVGEIGNMYAIFEEMKKASHLINI